MKFGCITLSIVSGRAEPADPAEIVTQLLFGDHYKVLEERSQWVKVRMAYDKYECWICRKQHSEITKEEYTKLDASKTITCTADLVSIVKAANQLTPIVLGSTVPNFRAGAGRVGEFKFEVHGEVVKAGNAKRNDLVSHAIQYLHAPYLWGGRSPFGIDCSGFTQIVYKLAGHKLPRDSKDQAELGQTLSFIEEAEPGDLAFFANKEGNIHHVGLLLENNQIIHASGKVRIDRIDHQGIYNNEQRSYSHKLRFIKKVL